MRLNKITKIVIAILLIALTMMVVSQTVLATGAKSLDPMHGDLTSAFDAEDTSGASEAAGKMIGMIINIAQVIGTGVAIIMLIVLAIKYIAASPEGKADIKKNATVYIVGAVILFAASGILAIVRRFAVKSIDTQGNLNAIN